VNKILIVILFCFLTYGNLLFAQVENYRTNYVIFDSLMNKCLNEISDEVTILGNDRLYKINIKDNSDKKNFIENSFKQKFYNSRFIYVTDSDSIDYNIEINKIKFKTLYPKIYTKGIWGNDFFKREINVAFECKFISKDSKFIKDIQFDKKYSDDISSEYYEYIQGNDFSFMKSALPEKPFFKKIFIPAVAVIVSAVIVILFFSIRSK